MYNTRLRDLRKNPLNKIKITKEELLLNFKFKSVLCFILSVCLMSNALVFNAFADETGKTMKKAKYPNTINVGKEDRYQFHSVQEALNSVTEEPTAYAPLTIVIDAGVYEEEVNVKLPYVTFKAASGKSAKDIVITYDKANGHVDDPNKAKGTGDSATVTVEATAVGFTADGITFENSYNIGEAHAHRPQAQAVALVTFADKIVLNNCRFIGRQDTLYLQGASKGKDVFGDANNARVYVKNCYIEGTVDYIFGNATAFFDGCSINTTYRQYGGYYTAANTTLSNIGYVFKNCTLTTDSEYGSEPTTVINLGRPWQGDDNYPYYGSQVAYIDCVMPDTLNPKGFVPWNDSTVKNKVRFMEYGSVDKNGNPVDISARNDFIRMLTKEQAEAYSVYNVLRGNDDWNPSNSKVTEDNKVSVLDITLDNYSITMPKNSTKTIKALILPLNADNKNFSFSVSNPNVASIDENGVITALSEGTTKVIATTEENAFSVYAELSVTPEKTSIPVIKDIKLSSDTPKTGDTISVSYNYELKSDDSIDNATIKWYAVNSDGDEFPIYQGKGQSAKSYTVSDFDVDYKIKAEVYPETSTTYGEYGNPVSVVSDAVITKDGNKKTVYLKDNFSDITKKWNTDGNLISYKNAENENEWGNISYSMRMRFDPTKDGISSADSINIYTAYKGKDRSYYRLNIVKGGNSESLKVYLYKKAERADEVLLVSDEQSLSKKVPQNKGEKNPFFTVGEIIDDGNITVTFTIEGESNPAMTMSYKDDEPIQGFTAFESTSDSLLKTSLTVGKYSKAVENNDVIKICLVGDSTVKSYGSDNTIGGWGEYLQYYFDSDHVKIINKAEGGRSTRSFLNQGRLKDAVKDLGEGDYLFIQFGHNDARTDENAFLEHSVPLGTPDANGIYPTNAGVKSKTPQGIYDFYKDMPYEETFYSYESGGTFKWFLKQYVDEARKVGATPVLITPVARVFFDSNGKITPHHGENDGYVKAVLQLADEMDVACVDMFEITKTMYENYGVRVTQGLQNIKSDGTMDITHYNKFGSNIVTSKLVEALRQAGIYACVYSKASDKAVSKTEDLKTAFVYVAGGSNCVVENNADDYVIKKDGWVPYIEKYFADQITVLNMAQEGKSSKSYVDTDQYKAIFANISEGDYLLIQFGPDDIDENNKANYTNPTGDKDTEGSFQYYLYNYYIKPALDKKAIPIIISPCAVAEFDSNGVSNVYSEYIEAIKTVATESGAYYINLNDVLAEKYNSLGEDNANLYHAVYKDLNLGKNGFDVYELNKSGAINTAKTVLKQIGFSSATLKDYINTSNLDSTEYVERGEFITDLLDIIDDDDNIEYFGDNFDDISDGKTYTEAVGKAKQLGIIEKTDDNMFRPEENITVTELMQFVEKVLAMKNKRANFDFSTFSKLLDKQVSIEQEMLVLRKLYEAISK